MGRQFLHYFSFCDDHPASFALYLTVKKVLTSTGVSWKSVAALRKRKERFFKGESLYWRGNGRVLLFTTHQNCTTPANVTGTAMSVELKSRTLIKFVGS